MQNGALQKLFDLIATLRGENGCPWDRVQKPDDVLSDLIEEAYELQWARASGSEGDLLEELADVVFVLTFAIALIQEEHPDYTLERLVDVAHEKIKRRHPHVFGDEVARTREEGLAHWDRMKEEEKRDRTPAKDIVADLPANLPPMRLAEKIQKRAARNGFDWPNTEGILEKIREETSELEAALSKSAPGSREDELGDLFFSVINLCRFLHIDPDKALARTNAKFVRRYRRMAELAQADEKSLSEMSLDEMDSYWVRAKLSEDTF